MRTASRVLFIYPNLDTQEGFNHGLAALAGALEATGATTKLINLNNALAPVLTDAEILTEIESFDPDLICFSVMSQQYPFALELARKIKERFAFPIAVGGVHASMATEEVARDEIFDYIGVGECDEALPRLLAAIKEEHDVTSIPNIWAWRDGKVHRNPPGPFPRLDLLPPKQFELFDIDLMLRKMNGWMSLLTSRGCPYRCTYCFNHKIVRSYQDAGVKPATYLRRYPLERVLHETQNLHQRHPDIKTFIFDDDLFTLDEQWVLDFCEGYEKLALGVPFVVNAHVQSFTRAMATALKRAGCLILKFGLESGSERIRRSVLNRRMTNDQIAAAFAIAHEEGMHTSAFVMFGLPLEEREDLEATIDLLAAIRPGRFRWSLFHPFPGTDIYELCRRHKLIDPKRAAQSGTFYDSSCLRFGAEHELWINKLQRAFHWYVNARVPGAGLQDPYLRLIDELEGQSAAEWQARSREFLDEDRRLSTELTRQGRTHYSIRYTQVMAVRSDFEEDNACFNQQAKEWSGRIRGTETLRPADHHQNPNRAGTAEGAP